MSVMKIIIPGELPTLNEIVAAAKSHYGSYAKLKKENTEKVQWLSKRLPKMKRIFLTFNWYCKDKRKNKDNIAVGKKFILDGLQQAEIISNDGWAEIDGWKDLFYIDKSNPRVEVDIEEVA